ncbi:MAG: PIG-L deacetylase family protein [Patescibacteria group bacterium]|jgi:LmbE family N-acetylglucosaminyl deacetylase
MFNCDNFLDFKKDSKVAIIGAHPDDIELSCSGLISALISRYSAKISTILVTSGGVKSDPRIREEEQKKVNDMMGIQSSHFLNFADGNVQHNLELVSSIESTLIKISPDVVVTHYTQDHHQDHIAVSKATLSATRNMYLTILMYPSWGSREVFIPNLYVELTEENMQKKLEAVNAFRSQANARYMDDRSILARGAETGLAIDASYAEKFYLYFTRISLMRNTVNLKK